MTKASTQLHIDRKRFATGFRKLIEALGKVKKQTLNAFLILKKVIKRGNSVKVGKAVVNM